MPINPNIALGVRPTEQPNMLAQMGQMMQLRQMQQGFESENALRDAFAQGADLNDPESFKRIASINPKLAYDLRSKGIDQRQKQTEIGLKVHDALGAALGGLVQNPTLDYAKATFSHLVSTGVLPEDKATAMYAKLEAEPNRIKEYATLGVNAAISAKEKMADATSRANNAATVGASYYGHNVSRENSIRTDTRAREELQYLQGQDGFYGVNKFDPNSARPVGIAPQPVAPAATPATSTVATGVPSNSLLITGAAPTTAPNVNALRGGAPNQAGPTVANAVAQTAATATQPTQLRPVQTPTLTEVDDPANPGQKLKIDARTYKGGTVGDPGVLGVARTEKLTPQQTVKLKAEMGKEFESVKRVVQQTNELLESIDAVRNSNLESVTGQFDARTPSFRDEAQIAETRFNNLKGKVTAIAKANASIGGAIGSIANQEWQILANQIAVLERTGGKTANLEQIDQLERQALSIVNRMRDGFERRYGENLDDLAPQYKELPNVNYTPGQYTPKGKKSSGVDNNNPLLQ